MTDTPQDTDEFGTRVSPSVALAEKNRLYGKVAMRLMPFLFLCYVLNYIDRSNVSFARLQLAEDLAFDDAVYGLGVSMFFVGYVLFEVPSNLLMARIGVRKTISRIMILWGLASVAMMFVTSPIEFYLARFLLGVAEAGFLPGIIYYLTLWFPAEWRGRIMSRLLVAIPISGILSGLISGTIMRHMDQILGLTAWQWLFLLEGFPAVVTGIIAFFYLTERPSDATWLTLAEKQTIRADLERDALVRQCVSAVHVSHRFGAALRNPKVYIAGFAYFTVMWASSLLNFWGPSIIQRSGIDNVLYIGLLSALPYLLGAGAMLYMCRRSDRRMERRWHFAAAVLVASGGAFLPGSADAGWMLSLFFLVILAIGYLSATALFWTVPPSFLSGAGAAGGIALIGSIAQLGAIFAPIVLGFMVAETGGMSAGFYIVSLVLVGGAAAIIIGIPKHLFRHDAQ